MSKRSKEFFIKKIIQMAIKHLKGCSTSYVIAAAAAKSLQSCLTLCNPRDGSPPGSPVPGIPQARTLEWVAISFSNAWKWKVKVRLFSHVRSSATLWTAAFQAPLSMEFSRQEYWSGVPLPSPSYVIRELQIKTTRKNIWVESHIVWWDDTTCNISNNDHVWGNKINLKFKQQKQWDTTIYLLYCLKSKTLIPNSSEDVGVEQQYSHLLLVIM